MVSARWLLAPIFFSTATSGGENGGGGENMQILPISISGDYAHCSGELYRAIRLHELQLNFDLSIISGLQISTRFLDFTRYSLSPIKLKLTMAQHNTDLIVYIYKYSEL